MKICFSWFDSCPTDHNPLTIPLSNTMKSRKKMKLRGKKQ